MNETTTERKRAGGEGGFTLIELLVVIIILGILASVVVFAVGGVSDKGQGAACRIDTRTLRTSLEAYSAQPAPKGGGGGYVASTNVPATGAFSGSPGNGDLLETALVTGGFLSESSNLHYVSDVVAPVLATSTPGSFKIRVQSASCGTVGAEVGTPLPIPTNL